MSMDECRQFLFEDKNQLTMFPSLKKNFQQRLLRSKDLFVMSPDERTYRMTSNQILKGIFKQNDREIKKLRTTFLKQPFEPIGTKKIGQYKIIKQIGKGGFAQVYEVEDQMGKRYALKEYNLQTALQCFHNESNVGDCFFQNGTIRQGFEQHEGSKHLIAFVGKFRMGKFGYILQELASYNLSKLISDIQGIFHNNERIYQVRFKDFYRQLGQKNYLKTIMIQLCQAVSLINKRGFIHCDLKLQNIMVQFEENEPKLKLIDFGSTFEVESGLPKITITPEYMPPQLLITLENGSNDYQILRKVDVWSIGCILLEILTGIPLWFRYKCKVEIKGKAVVQLGLFALTGREYSKIIKKQRQLIENINRIQFTLKQFDKFRPILKKLLVLNPTKRITLDQCISKLEELE